MKAEAEAARKAAAVKNLMVESFGSFDNANYEAVDEMKNPMRGQSPYVYDVSWLAITRAFQRYYIRPLDSKQETSRDRYEPSKYDQVV